MDFDLSFWGIVLLVWLFCGLLGYSIGNPVKLGSAGFCWGFSFGPLGLIIIALLTIREKLPDPGLMALLVAKVGQRAEPERERGRAPQAAGVQQDTPGGTMAVIRVARGKEELGAWSLSDIRKYLTTGELAYEDCYFDGAAKQWLALAAHPGLS